jgi:hypothetical protein
MERKAIQIVAYPDHLYALCDDGAIFQLSQGAWYELEPIPHAEKTGLTEAEITSGSRNSPPSTGWTRRSCWVGLSRFRRKHRAVWASHR